MAAWQARSQQDEAVDRARAEQERVEAEVAAAAAEQEANKARDEEERKKVELPPLGLDTPISALREFPSRTIRSRRTPKTRALRPLVRHARGLPRNR